MHVRSLIAGLAVILSSGAGPAAIARAQPPADTAAALSQSASPTATPLHGGQWGELLSVYVPRGEDEIQRLLDDARNMQRAAAREIDGTRRLAVDADGRARIMKEEIETTKVRREVAKKAKDAAARAELDATFKRQQREHQYLEHLRDAMRADADRLEAERTASAARVKALELELKVAREFAAVGTAAPAPEAVARYRSILRELLDAQKQSASQWRVASEKRGRVADRRLKQLQSLSRLSKP